MDTPHQHTVNASGPSKKQAVVVIHGMGEQRPMETIREFVNQVWKQDKNLSNPHFWNKPSSVSESFEQRRLTTDTPAIKGDASSARTKRTDFYEYYWQHQMVSTQWAHFLGWVKTLLWCSPSKYKQHPDTLYPLWFILWGGIFVSLIILGLWYWVTTDDRWANNLVLLMISVGWGFLIYKLKGFLTSYFGDVARYVRAEPTNIAIRQAVRKDGVDLLERIHNSGEYDRIVLVGHSLGSIVAYDLLTHLWARHNKFKYRHKGKLFSTPLTSTAISLIERLQTLSETGGKRHFEQEQYWQAQRELFNELRATDPDNNWLISDFITLGSPLTYADVLLMENELDFTMRRLDREFPTSPPVREEGKWYYKSNGECYLHHGAVFGPVKWTNIYMGHDKFIKGDFISGPVSKNFSYSDLNLSSCRIDPPMDLHNSCIKEIKLTYTDIKDGFTHTKYWQPSENNNQDHLNTLRDALALY